MLTWKVAGEKINTQYVVERSADGIHFNAIGTVNGTGLHTYTYNDPGLQRGNRYYRVKEMNAGRSYYSHIIAVLMGSSTGQLQIAPNPVRDGNLRFSFAGDDTQPFEINIYTTDGRLMLVHKQVDGVGLLSIGHLPNGMYNFLIRQGKIQYRASFVKKD